MRNTVSIIVAVAIDSLKQRPIRRRRRAEKVALADQ